MSRAHRHTRREFLPFICALATNARAQTFPYDLLVKGGRVIDPSQSLSEVRDVAISGGKVARVDAGIPSTQARLTLDARGKIAVPRGNVGQVGNLRPIGNRPLATTSSPASGGLRLRFRTFDPVASVLRCFRCHSTGPLRLGVTPGLVDIHVHVYDGVAPLGIPADPNCIAKGATTVVDAGSAGAHTFPAFRRLAIQTAETRIYALLNISVVGQSTLSEDNPWGELLDLRYANAKLAIKTIEQNRDVILGMKVRLSRNIAGDHDLAALRLAREAAEAVNLPLMTHIGDTASPLQAILKELRKGDVITHSFHGRTGGILDSRGRVLPEVLKAVEGGVRLDVGHGRGSFSWRVMESAMKQGILPGTISSDVHQFNVAGPVFDLATTLSKFLHLGMPLEQVIERATINPARTFRFPHNPGTLKVGAEADVAVFQIQEGDFEMTESDSGAGAPEKKIAHRKLLPVATVKAGKLYGSASM